MILAVTLSKPSKVCEQLLGRLYTRVKIRYTNTSSGPAWFAEFFTETQAFHKKFSEKELNSFLNRNIGKSFFNCIEQTETERIIFLTNKKGKTSEIHKKIKNTPLQATARREPAFSYDSCPLQNQEDSGIENTRITGLNRVKNYIIPEGQPIPFLVHLGIMTDKGKIIAAKYDKFRQINRFLEYIDDILPDIMKNIKNSAAAECPVRIVDFGCGKSYLTFAVHYFLTELKKISVEITGLDLKKDVISYCTTLASQFNCKGLNFSVGDIAGFVYDTDPDLVITLHACDTATDYALAYAVKHHATAILSVPCCQHELNRQITEGTKPKDDSPFATLLHYGLIKERFSALATDALRAEYLEQAGYSVQILEFIDSTHTPKNLLIRAVLKKTAIATHAAERAQSLTELLHVSPTLRGLLQD